MKMPGPTRWIKRYSFGLIKLIYAVQQLESLSFKEVGSALDKTDILGEFFEKILRSGFKQNKGQFFTHTNIVNFILYGLKLDEFSIDLISKKTGLSRSKLFRKLNNHLLRIF